MSDDQIKGIRAEAHQDQLTPSRTPHTNSVLKGPPDTDIGDLACELAVDADRSVVTISAWELDDRHREMIAAGAHMRMSVWQHPIPPLALAVEAPFCDQCAVEKVWVRAAKEFVCATNDCPACDARVHLHRVSRNGSVVPPPDQRADDAEGGGDASRRALDAAKRDFSPGGDVEREEGD